MLNCEPMNSLHPRLHPAEHVPFSCSLNCPAQTCKAQTDSAGKRKVLFWLLRLTVELVGCLCYWAAVDEIKEPQSLQLIPRHGKIQVKSDSALTLFPLDICLSSLSSNTCDCKSEILRKKNLKWLWLKNCRSCIETWQLSEQTAGPSEHSASTFVLREPEQLTSVHLHQSASISSSI